MDTWNAVLKTTPKFFWQKAEIFSLNVLKWYKNYKFLKKM